MPSTISEMLLKLLHFFLQTMPEELSPAFLFGPVDQQGPMRDLFGSMLDMHMLQLGHVIHQNASP